MHKMFGENKQEYQLEKADVIQFSGTRDLSDGSKIESVESIMPLVSGFDNSENSLYFSQVPDFCKSSPCVVGVDEAGRGPVLGPMVYGIAYCPLDGKQSLIDLSCADSKQLSEEKRDAIFNEMNKEEFATCVGWAVELISPSVISTSMHRRTKCSLNEISMNSAIGLIHRIYNAGVIIAEVYVDTVGPPEKYQEKLQAIFPRFKITVAKKADSTYPIVSAASICAKVTRDHVLKNWRLPEKVKLSCNSFGSGYPGDPVTKRFLSENIESVFGFPRLVRFSWSTAENVLEGKAYGIEFDQPDSEKSKYAGPKLTKFFKGTGNTGEVKRHTCEFYEERFMYSALDF